MNEKVNIHSENRCILCNKVYSSRSSLCNHNKKFHNTISKQKVNISKHNGQQKVNMKILF